MRIITRFMLLVSFDGPFFGSLFFYIGSASSLHPFSFVIEENFLRLLYLTLGFLAVQAGCTNWPIVSQCEAEGTCAWSDLPPGQ